jgi:hypothetical protein
MLTPSEMMTGACYAWMLAGTGYAQWLPMSRCVEYPPKCELEVNSARVHRSYRLLWHSRQVPQADRKIPTPTRSPTLNLPYSGVTAATCPKA